LPINSSVGSLTSITLGGSSVTFTNQTIKGVQYAIFVANSGSYVAKYTGGGAAPVAGLSPTSLAFGNQTVGTTSAAKIVTLSNTGNAALTITGISLTGTSSTSFAQTNNCGTSVAAGSNCTISVTFKPSTTGVLSASLSVADNAAGSPQAVAVTGTGTAAAPAVSFSPTSLAFGNQTTNTTSTARPVTLSNTGTGALTITSISLAGTNPTNFAQTNNCGTSVAAGANCTINVTFTPSATGARSASLSVADNAAGTPQTVALTGTGVAPAPAVSFSPTSLTFAAQALNTTSAAQSVTLTNTGAASLTISGYSFTGTNAIDFSQTHTCGTTLAAGASCTISVSFKPTSAGTRTASLAVADNAPGSPQTVALTGTGNGPGATLSPTSLSFGLQLRNTTSAAKTVTLTNTGNATLTISNYSFTGTNPTNFAQTHTCGSTLAPGTSCTIRVTFTPSGTGSRSATLNVSTNAAGSPQTATLTGLGL
jgi:Abnormal spindle-like microcephaly-assoc'd, ASPM-SPD-2-Hydin